LVRVRVGDLFTFQEPKLQPLLLVHYVADDPEGGPIIRVLRQPGPAPADPCDAVRGETWFYVSTALHVAVSKGLAVRVGWCEPVEQPTFRRLLPDGTWSLLSGGQRTNLGRTLTPEQRRLSPWNMATPLAVIDYARAGYVVEDDYVEVPPRPPALVRLARRLAGKPSPWSPGGAYWPIPRKPGPFGASRSAEDGSAATVLYTVTVSDTNERTATDRLLAHGWRVNSSTSESDQSLLDVSRDLPAKVVLSDVTAMLESALEELAATVDGPDVTLT
jgi:hypothetical protein